MFHGQFDVLRWKECAFGSLGASHVSRGWHPEGCQPRKV
jgi:hypothetical protein